MFLSSDNTGGQMAVYNDRNARSFTNDIDDALIEGLEQNQDFFSLLLSNDEIKKQVLGIFTEEIYKSLREA